MHKTKVTENPNAPTTALVPQAKRYDEAFKLQAVEHWLHSGHFCAVQIKLRCIRPLRPVTANDDYKSAVRRRCS